MKRNVCVLATLVLVAAASLAGCSKKSSSPTAPTTPAGPYGTIERYMGITGQAGLGGEGVAPTSMKLFLPMDIAFGPLGRAYVLDWNNHRVRRVDADGLVRTVIGTGLLGDAPEGPPLNAGLNHPTHVAFDPLGRLILSAWHNSKIMRVDFTADNMERICGDGRRSYDADSLPATTSAVDLPMSTALDGAGNIFFMDQANQLIRRIDAATGIVTNVAGQPDAAGFSGDGGPATAARMNQRIDQAAFPGGRVIMAPNQDLYFADSNNHRVRKVDALTGIITTVAGSGPVPVDYDPGAPPDSTYLAAYFPGAFSGDGGPATQARLNYPTDLALDSAGNLYIADTFNHCVRKVDVTGMISTFAGRGGMQGSSGDGGSPTSALLDRPYGVACDAQDNVYVIDTHNHVIRVVRK